MAMQRLKDGEDFGAAHFAQEKDFGFSGSAQGYDGHPVAPPFAGSKPTDNGENFQTYAKGGEVKHEGHGHPHGHHVVHVHHDPSSGAVIHHHAHGGYTMHHPEGHVTHHTEHGHHLAHGGHMAHQGGEGTHVAKLMSSKAVHQHEDHEHHGEHTDLHLARGGKAHMPNPMAGKEPMNRPPRHPQKNTSPPNQMPGGQMAYGVQPSAEPDQSGDMPQMHKGGKMRHHRG